MCRRSGRLSPNPGGRDTRAFHQEQAGDGIRSILIKVTANGGAWRVAFAGRTCERYRGSSMGSPIPAHADDALAFAVRVAQLLDEGRRASTYKFAVLVGLMDLAQEELGTTGEAPTNLPMDRLARRVAELYWPHVRLYPSERPKVLSQNRGGQAEILTAIARFLRDNGLGATTRIAEGASAGTPFNHLLDRVVTGPPTSASGRRFKLSAIT